MIVGTPDHPEVLAIAGWCRSPVVVSGAEELEHWLQQDPERRNFPLTFVSQTTSTRKIWDDCVKKAKKECTNAEFFDTICGATSKRQEEARQLAQTCGMMVVIGDRKSSNTRRLAEICREACPDVRLIERAADLDLSHLPRAERVGITAGASTPAWIIKEVYDKMSDEIMEIEKSFAELLEESIKTLNNGDKVTGTVVAVTPTEVQVELGIKYPGYIALSELTDDPNAKVEDLVKVGDEIESIVMQVSDRDCLVKLSKRRLDINKGWEEIEAAQENETVAGGRCHRGQQGRRGRLRQGRPGVRARFPDRPAPGDSHERAAQEEGPSGHHRGQPCPPPCGGLHQPGAAAPSGLPPLRRSGPRSRTASTTPAP